MALLSNKSYDVLKWVAAIGLPALATFVSALGIVWGWESTEAIVATLVAINTFIGALVGISSANYRKEG